MREKLIGQTASVLATIGEAFLLGAGLLRGGDLLDALNGDWLSKYAEQSTGVRRELDADFRKRVRRAVARPSASTRPWREVGRTGGMA